VLYDVYDIFEVVTANQKLVMVLYFLNPMSGILEWYRYSFLSSELTKGQENPLVSQLNTFIFYGAIPYAIIASFAMLIIGYWALKKLETRAVDEL
jgi:ABC-type polysaccharide/polyol phosphate export permease